MKKQTIGYVALCPELDIASQGDRIEDAKSNLKETLEMFFETALPDEIGKRLRGRIYVASVELAVG